MDLSVADARPQAPPRRCTCPQEVPGYVNWKCRTSALLGTQVLGILGWAGICPQDLPQSWLRSGTYWHHGSGGLSWLLGLYKTCFQHWFPSQQETRACWIHHTLERFKIINFIIIQDWWSQQIQRWLPVKKIVIVPNRSAYPHHSGGRAQREGTLRGKGN